MPFFLRASATAFLTLCDDVVGGDLMDLLIVLCFLVVVVLGGGGDE